MRKMIGSVFLLLILYFISPLYAGIFHIGMIWPSLLFLIGAVICFFPQLYKRIPVKILKIFRILCCLGLVCLTVLFSLMGITARNDQAPEDATVIIMGCQVYDGNPSVMLQNRISVAYNYLKAHPDAVCIASGGMDDSEDITEALCIYNELITMGIESNRIYLEDTSGSTYENIRNSLNVIDSRHLSRNVVIATDRFHQYRSHCYARRQGLTPYTLSCSSPFFLAPGYWCREVVAIGAMYLRGY